MTAKKLWGGKNYYGLDDEFDLQWYLTESQRKLQKELIEVCHDVIRPQATIGDETHDYPWKSIEALAELRLLGCIIPEKWGGRGENHVGLAMIAETIGRYGCPSLGVIYQMHMAGVAALLFRAGGSKAIQDVLMRMDKDVLIGSASYTDPETGGHFWYPKISGAKKVEGGWQVKKTSAFTTSCGHAKWMVTQTTSPDFTGDYSDLSVFLMFPDEMDPKPGLWDVIGMRATSSGPISFDATIPEDRIVGPPGDGAASNDEAVNAVGMVMYGAVYNGISMSALDLAKRHTTQRRHANFGQTIADYTTTQDVYGRGVIDTWTSRVNLYSFCQELDRRTNNGSWTIYEDDPDTRPRSPMILWGLIVKEKAAKVASEVTENMFRLFGGSGLSRKLEIERILRDSKAGWLMAPSNEVARGMVGRWALFGSDAVDWWNQQVNEGLLTSELSKLDAKAKRSLIAKLNAELGEES